tara:strand:+ start:912 stop:1400 length:489 start_codon:yes stop_codon:yes gene_type:complete
MADLKDYAPAVVAMITIVITIIVGSIIITDLGTRTTNTADIVNETLSVSSLPAKLSRGFLVNSSVQVFNVTNETTQALIPAGDYGIQADNGQIELMNNTAWGPTVNVSYSYKIQDGVFNTSRSSNEGLGELSSFTAITALVVAATIIIGLISVMFVSFKRRS